MSKSSSIVKVQKGGLKEVDVLWTVDGVKPRSGWKVDMVKGGLKGHKWVEVLCTRPLVLFAVVLSHQTIWTLLKNFVSPFSASSTSATPCAYELRLDT